jgi:N-acetylglucosaminyldiphosphoundecaprenol N-acetyl-beta-D-mannosaminyltransferase
MDKDTERNFITIMGVNVDRLKIQKLIGKCKFYCRKGKPAKIMYANIHTINLAFEDPTFRRTLNSADIVYCDGEGVRWAARFIGKPLPQRMTGADWIWELCGMCERERLSIFLLGGANGIAERAAVRLQAKLPDLKIAGTHHGFFLKSGKENHELIDYINKKDPDILMVGFGSPIQEKWIQDNFEKLKPCVVWAVGALWDFISGSVPRGPRCMVENGMEWLFRFLLEPRRMWRRYIIGNSTFVRNVLKEKFICREV